MLSVTNRRLASPHHFRRALLAGTVLGAGALIGAPYAAKAADYVYTGPAATGTAVSASISAIATGADKITITTITGGTVTSAVNGGTNGMIKASSQDGDIALNLADAVSNTGTGYGVYAASTGAGSITLTGAGDLSGGRSGIYATTFTGAITLGGSGAATSLGSSSALFASITGAASTSDILITRSGALTGSYGVNASTLGSGKITIQGVGAINATNQGISSSAKSGATLIDLTNNVTAHVANTSGAAIYAGSTTGDITIKTASGVAVTSDSTGIFASSSGGNIDIGGAAGLGGAVSGAYGITAATTGSGTINVKTAVGGTVTGGSNSGIQTSTINGATVIALAAAVSGNSSGVNASSSTGAISIISTSAISGATGVGISAVTAGNIDIGAAAGLSGAVSGGKGIDATTTGGGTINVKTAAGGTVTGTDTSGNYGAINTNAVNGATTIDIGAAVTGAVAAVSATSGSGAIAITSTASLTGANAGIQAQSAGGAIDIGGAAGLSGAVSGGAGVFLATNGSGTINVKTAAGGTVTGLTGYGVLTSANNGATVIALAAAVSGGSNGIRAASTTGAVSITSTSAISGVIEGIWAESTSGNLDIGGAAGLSGAVSGTTGILASTTGSGTLSVKTAAGGNVTGASARGISTSANNGATSITIGAGSTVTGATNAVQSTTGNGDVVVNNAGTVKGALNAVLSSGGTGTFTFNNSGTLALNGTQGNTGFTLNNLSGGVLTGDNNGTFGNVTAASGSIIRPGDRTLAAGSNGVPQMGTLKADTLTLASGAIVEVRVDATGINDKVAVTYAASLGGATLNLIGSPNSSGGWASTISTKQKYTVLTASTLTGTFGAVTSNLTFLKATADYSTANQVDVTFASNGVAYTTVAQTGNQTAVAKVLQTATTNGTLSANGQALVDKINGSVTNATAPSALGSLSGEQITNTQSATILGSNRLANAIGNQALGALNGPGASLSSGGALAYTDNTLQTMAAVKATRPKDVTKAPVAPERTWRVWATTVGGLSETAAKNGNPRVTGSDVGGVVGFDKVVAPGLIAGFAFGGTNSASSVDGGATKGNTDAGHLSLYGLAESGPIYVSASLGYGRYSSSSTRTVTGIGSTEIWKGNYGANGYSGDVEVGYRYKVGQYQITPFAGVRYNVIQQDAYSEKSDDPLAVFGLSYAAKSTRSLPASLGVQAETGFGASNGWQITGLSRLAWVHEFETSRSIDASFVNLPGASFTATGASADADLGRLTAGLNFANSKGATVYATLTGDFSDTTRAGTLQAGYKYQW